MSHHLLPYAIGLFALLLTAGIVRLVIGNPGAARHRVRVLRWRIKCYLRPGPGFANSIELLMRWSRLRAVITGRRSRPSLPWWARMILPATAYAVRLGRAQLGRRVFASMEDQTLVIAAPRAGKSGWLADRIIDHPGAVVTTTTRTDLLENTAPLRGQHGTVHVFNPEGIGGYLSTFRWNPLQDCKLPAVALQRALALTAATESGGLQDMAFWVGKASAVLACFLHAAALQDLTMNEVYRWAHGIDDDVPAQILATHPGAAESWLGPVREVRKPGRQSDSIRMTMTRALAWLADPAIAAAATPSPGEGFDVASFAAGRNTLYMIGTGREDTPIAPLFRAFAEYVHDGAAFTGSFAQHRKLDPPLLMALDEVTQICPVPLPLWMADSAGKGIQIIAICHGLAQLEGRWDRHGAQAIWDTAGLKIILGGVTDADTLDQLSRLCGDIDLRAPSRSIDEYGRQIRTWSYQPVRVLPPELLRTLPDWRALAMRGNLSPVVIRLRMAWRRHDYRHARRSAQHAAAALPAAEPYGPVSPWPANPEDLIAPPPIDEPWHPDPADLPSPLPEGLRADRADQPPDPARWPQADRTYRLSRSDDPPSGPPRPWHRPDGNGQRS
ncbi:MAG TPA: type IV secretory system conjugative DNA transfer family protein [Streptosporangiaceae bacterium]|nr:type IV secretory system conjugative DNA transfer family protein [Streptosporangiaceae bacterium]